MSNIVQHILFIELAPGLARNITSLGISMFSKIYFEKKNRHILGDDEAEIYCIHIIIIPLRSPALIPTF